MGKHLDFYERNIEHMIMPDEGLCMCASDDKISSDILEEYFQPTPEERYDLVTEGLSTFYWGSGISKYNQYDEIAYVFTPLRQTIVLFMAAINNEL